MTERKGSNPGGKVLINTLMGEMKGYLKYCVGSKGEFIFKPEHQPIYESLTNQLLLLAGLMVPETFVIPGKEISFANIQEFKDFSDLHNYYFFSKWVNCAKGDGDIPLREEKILELFLVSDITGRKDNYALLGNGRIIYYDLGCSFVLCKGGYISPLSLSKKHILGKKELKSIRNFSKKVILNNQVKLFDIIEDIKDIEIPLLKGEKGFVKKYKLEDLIDKEEIEHIQELLWVSLKIFKENYKNKTLEYLNLKL